MGGSSPRLRGTHAGAQHQDVARRFIPASAGNTVGAWWKVWPRPVHPRVCGEHIYIVGVAQPIDGSSPRLRGTPSMPRRQSRSNRFIPASAGNTMFQPLEYHGRPVHPRVCGEHDDTELLDVFGNGSSPRLRGTRHRHSQPGGPARFIPASAGNTDVSLIGFELASVHPRVCGEHRATNDTSRTCDGSSPRLRGTRQKKRRRSSQSGSSPRLRGTRCQLFLYGVVPRFIPASAGNTAAGRPSRGR